MFNAESKYIEHLRAARWEYLARTNTFRSAFRGSGWSEDAHADTKVGETMSDAGAIMPISFNRTQSLDSTHTLHRMDSDEKQRILILNPDFVTIRTDMLEEEKVTPMKKLLALAGKFSILMFLNITLGGGAFESPWGIRCNSPSYWVVHVIMIAFLIASAWAAQVRFSIEGPIEDVARRARFPGQLTTIAHPPFAPYRRTS